MNETTVRAQIVQICHQMYQQGLICSGDGNVSARLSETEILLTPAKVHKGFLKVEDLIVIDPDGNVIRGDRRPSSELPMHLEAFRQRPDIGAVIHAHPPTAVALSIAEIPMDMYMLPEAILMLGTIPTAPYATPSSEENAAAIRTLIQDHDGIMLQRHGSLTVADDLMMAFMRLETLEQNARIRFRLHQLGVTDVTLEDVQVEKLLRQREGHGWLHPSEWDLFAARTGRFKE